MSAPHTTQNGGARTGRLPLLLFWAGVALAPLAALLLWLGSGGGPLKAAAVLAVGSAVLIGLSVVLRRDGETTRIELQETMVSELAAVRAEVAHQIAASGENEVLRHQVGMLSGEVDALRQELVAVQDKQAAHAAPAQPEPQPQPARVPADREPEVQLSTEPVAENALRDGRLVSAVAEPPQQSRRDRPANVYRTETVQVTTHTTRVSEVAEPELVGASGGRTYGSRPGYGGTYGSPAGGAGLPTGDGGNDRVDRWAERLGARAERFGSTGERLAERLSGARAMRRDRDEDPLADLRASSDSDDLAGGESDDPWNGLRPDDTFDTRRPTDHDAAPSFADPETPASGTHYRAPTDYAATPSGDVGHRTGTEYGARPAPGEGRTGTEYGGRSAADPGGRAGTEYGGRSGRGGYDDEDAPRLRTGRRRAELRVTDEWAEISAPGRSDGRTADLVGGRSTGGRTADLVSGRHGSPDDIDGDWRETSLPGQPGRPPATHARDDFDTPQGWDGFNAGSHGRAGSHGGNHGRDELGAGPGRDDFGAGNAGSHGRDEFGAGSGGGHGRDDFGGYGGRSGRAGRPAAEPLAITQGDEQQRWSQLDRGDQAGGRQHQSGERPGGRQFQGGEQAAGRQFRGGERPGGRQFQGGEQAAGRQFRGGEQVGGRPFSGGEPGVGSDYQSGRDHQTGGRYQSGSHAAAPVSPAGPGEPRYGRDTSDTHRVGAGGEYGSRHSRRDGSYADESTGSWVDEEETTGGWRSDGQHQSQQRSQYPGQGRHGTAEPQAAGGQYRSAGAQQPGRHQGGEYQARGGGQYQGHGGGRYQPEDDERPSRHGRSDTGRW